MTNDEQRLAESMQNLIDAMNPEEANRRKSAKALAGCGCLILTFAFIAIGVACIAFIFAKVWKMSQ